MRRLSPPPSRPLSSLLAVVLVTIVALLPAQPAAAHGTLAMSAPASGTTVSEPLTAVELYFTEKVPFNAYFTITAPGGGRVDSGWSYGQPKPLAKPVREYVLVDGVFEPREYATGFPAVVTMTHLPAVGQYSVSYLSVASDGEPVQGTMSFRYAGRVTAAPAGWSPPTNPPDPALVAAVAQQETAGHGPSAQTTSAAPPVPAASPVTGAGPADGDDGGSGLLAWAGAAVGLVALVVGLGVWRSRRLPADRPSGRLRLPTAAPRRRDARSSTTGDRGRKAVMPAAKRGAGAVVARVSTGSTAGRSPSAGPAAEGGRPAVPVDSSPSSRSAPPFGAVPGTPRLALLVGALVLSLVTGFGLGRTGSGERTAAAQAGPAAVGEAGATEPTVSAGDGHQHTKGAGAHTHPGDGGAGQPAAGTTVSAVGYTLQPLRRSQPVGASVDYRFRIVGTDGQPVTRFMVVHDKPLHLVVVGRDLGGYQHLHPTMAADGTWSVPLRLARAGTYRIYADFSVAAGDATPLPLVLGVDHHVPGAYAPVELPAAQPQAEAGPFTVAMTGTPTAGVTVPMAFGVGRDGTAGPVPVQRYLGAYGHLVVIREGDLGYVHVHPEPDLVDGAITFWLTAPSAGRYRAFLDFQVDGTVHTAAYTIDVG
ncbi:copper resistance protein CopC [Micromonospora sp. BQ11]|uniref:copper resistance CopC family protein n=1 Tax=Micromonospora sp. BQ11 TaxID=3452212 RepID=UPI003F8959D8